MNTQLIVRVPAADKSWIEWEAQRLNTTVSNLVRQGLALLKTQTTTRQVSHGLTLVEIAESIRKKHPEDFKKTPTDLSVNYKHYLYGFPKK